MPSAAAIDKALIFQNLVNGVPVQFVGRHFNLRDEREVMDIFRYVANKIKTYMFQRTIPFISFDTPQEAKRHRRQLFDILKKINLDIVPLYTKFEVGQLEDAL